VNSMLTTEPMRLWSEWSGWLLPLLAAIVAATLGSRLASRWQSAGGRTATTGTRGSARGFLVEALTTKWQLTLLASTALVLSLASGWTTWDGMKNFTGEPVLSLMITFGIQGVMLIIAWLIGESFATGMSPRSRGSDRSAAPGRTAAGAGLIVGTLLALALSFVGARWLGVFNAPVGAVNAALGWSELADRALWIGVGLLLLATLILNRSSDVAAPYVQSARVIARNAVLWVMFLACMATSVFFSFDSLFSAIFPAEERRRAADIRAINQVAGIVADIGTLMQRRHLEEAEALFRSEGWMRWDEQLAGLTRQAQGAEQTIEAYFVQQMEARRRAVAEQQERISTANAGQAGLVSRKATMTDELSRIRAERPELAGGLARVKTELDERARILDEKRIEAQAEEKGAEGTLKAGRGPQWRERVAELARMQEAYKIQEERVREAQKRVANVDQRIAQLERELAGIDGDIAKLKGEAQTAENRIKAAEQSRGDEAALKVDPARIRNAFERARGEFRQDPTTERLAAVHQQCGQLLAAMTETPATKDRVRDIDCDAKQATDAAARVFALNAGMDTFARTCAGGDKLPQAGGIDALLSFGRRCLQDSGLPSRDSADMAAKISGIDLNRDDKAHRFVVTWNAFQDGNRLAYLALAIAIAIDSLVFMSGLFGANAVRSPLMDLEGRGEMSAEQLEATIDHTLANTSHPRATLVALLRAMHPIDADDGFTAEVWLDARDPLVEDMRAVLVAGSTIGAVRAISGEPSRYRISTGLARYFAIAQKKRWQIDEVETSRKELVNVVGVALMPWPNDNARLVLAELHPISGQAGFAAETAPSRIADKEHRRLVMNVLGAGATVAGAVHRLSESDDRYFVSTDLYKTLLLLGAGSIPAYDQRRMLRDEPLPPPRVISSPSPAIQTRRLPTPEAAPPRLLSRLESLASDDRNIDLDETSATRAAHPTDDREPAPESGLRIAVRDDLIQRGGLFPWSARDVVMADKPEAITQVDAAFARLSGRAPRFGKLVLGEIDAGRRSIKEAYAQLSAEHEDDALYGQVLETVAGELYNLMPVLIVSPGGPYQQILERLVDELEPQSAEGVLPPADQIVLMQARQQISALSRLSDRAADRLERVVGIIDRYDERDEATIASEDAAGNSPIT
jgi:hypothetical protein